MYTDRIKYYGIVIFMQCAGYPGHPPLHRLQEGGGQAHQGGPGGWG